MGCLTAVSQVQKQSQQCHGVTTATQCHQYLFSPYQQAILFDKPVHTPGINLIFHNSKRVNS